MHTIAQDLGSSVRHPVGVEIGHTPAPRNKLEYPPFGDAPYPANLVMDSQDAARDRVSVAFRIFLILPHLVALCFLSVAWAVTTIIAWFAILFTGAYPESLERFSRGVLRWNIRVEAYLLLLHDTYPPFHLDGEP